MAIGSSDFSKNSVTALQYRQDQQPVSEEFLEAKKQESKQVNGLNGAEAQKQRKEADLEKKGQEERQSNIVVDEKKASDVSDKMSALNVQLSFEIAKDGDTNVVKVVDQNTGDVVRQIPSEEFLKMSERIDEIITELGDIKGSLVNNRV